MSLLLPILIFKYALFVLLVLFVLGSAWYSLQSRRASDPLEKGRKRAVMNMLLGGMLITLSLMAMFLFRGSSVNIVVETLFLLLGLFNLFSGLRSHGVYSRSKARGGSKV